MTTAGHMVELVLERGYGLQYGVRLGMNRVGRLGRETEVLKRGLEVPANLA